MPSFNTYTDNQLLELLRKGDESAFTELYYRYVESLYAYAWNVLKVEEECKDAVEEVFIWLWESRNQLQVDNLKYYLQAAVKYKLLRAIKKSKRREEILSARPVMHITYDENVAELNELKRIINQFTEGLPSRAREIFRLSRNEYLTNKEIASKLKISEKTVENQITIVLKKLRHTLRHISLFSIFF